MRERLDAFLADVPDPTVVNDALAQLAGALAAQDNRAACRTRVSRCRGRRPTMKATSEPGWLRKLWPFLVRHKKGVLIAFGVAILGQVITSILPLVQRSIVDNTITTQTEPVGPLLVLLVGLAAVNFVFQYIRRYSGGRYAIDVQNDLRNALFERLQRLDFARHDELPTGQLVSRASSDLAARAAAPAVHADAHGQRRAARAVAVPDAADVTAAHAAHAS